METNPPPRNDVPVAGRKLTLWGASLGLAFAVGLGLLGIVNGEPPQRAAQAAGTLAMVIILATPPLVALATLKMPAILRGPFLLAAAALSFVSIGVSLAGVGIVFVPSSILFGIAAWRAFRRGGWARGAALLFLILTLGMAALFPYSFTRLYAGADEGRCWEYTRYRDGRVEWRESENTYSGSSRASGSFSDAGTSDVVGEGGACTSDIVTAEEAVESLTFWILGVAGFALVWVGGRRSVRLSP